MIASRQRPMAWRGNSRLNAGAVTSADASTPAQWAQWAQESCRIVGTLGFYPRDRVRGDDCAAHMDAVVIDRLAAAASRPAQVLNASLGAR